MACDKGINEHRENEEESGFTINKELVVYKVFYFFYCSGRGAFRQYYTMFLKQLWFSAEQVGFLYGYYNFCQFIGAPIMSAVADKTRKPLVVLLIAVLSVSVMAVVLSFAPSGVKPDYCYPSTNTTTLNETQNLVQREITSRNTESHKPNSDMIYKSHTIFFSTTFICIIFAETGSFMDGPANSIADTMTLTALQGHDKKYGYTRAFGVFGYGLTTVLVGILITFNTKESLACGEAIEGVDYTPCLYTWAVMSFLAFISVFGMKEKGEDKKQESKNLWINFKSGLSLTTIAVFFVAMINGMAKGIGNAFLFWHLQGLGGTQILFSTITLVRWISEFIGFLTAEFWINKLGHLNLICLSILGYSLRTLVYGLIVNPWLSLTIEWIVALTYSMFIAVGVSYLGLCPGVSATYQGIFTGLFWGLGPTIGPAIAGMALAGIGSKFTFLITSAVCFLTAVLFFIVVASSASDQKDEKDVGLYNAVSMEDTLDSE